ncbi:MAG: hypothetical protein HY908_24150, partial [Myxococcales bacterium]|nr:hypothetical protein [Myxococcales bacterium]
LVFFRQNEAARVRARLDELAQALEVHGPDQSFVLRAARIRQTVHEVVDKRASLQIADLTDGKPDRTTLIELAGQAPSVYSQARIDLGDLTIELDQAETSAHVHGTVTFTGRRHGGADERDLRAVSIRLDKIDGDWRVVSLAAAAPGETRAPE